jgi:predicted DNA-binding transcriptional regulator AlpA
MSDKFQISSETPLAAITIGQFKEIIGEIIKKEPTKEQTNSPDFPETFGKKECSQLTGYAVNTINKMICERSIPFYKKNARVIFKKSEIEEWLLSKRIPTNEEFVVNAENNLMQRRKNK